MWAHYAGGHGGVAIEFDFPDPPSSHGIPEVEYVPKLPENVVHGPPYSELDESPTPEDVLTKKNDAVAIRTGMANHSRRAVF